MRIEISRRDVRNSGSQVDDRNASAGKPAAEVLLKANLVVSLDIDHVEAIARRIECCVAYLSSYAAHLILNSRRRFGGIYNYQVDICKRVGDERIPFCVSALIRPLRSVPLHYQRYVRRRRQLLHFRACPGRSACVFDPICGNNRSLVPRLEDRYKYAPAGGVGSQGARLFAADTYYLRTVRERVHVVHLHLAES